MNLAILIPVRPAGEGKTRLAPAMAGPQRAALVTRMFEHVLAVAVRGGVPGAKVFVVSRSAAFLEAARAQGATAVAEADDGLNPALAQAAALADGESPVLALSADLPLLESADLAAMVEALGEADVVAASDRAGTGTNALLLRRPALIAYAFGEGSLARHREAAEVAGLRFAEVHRPGLAADVDLPGDLALLSAA